MSRNWTHVTMSYYTTNKYWLYVFTQPLHYSWMWHKVNFFSGVLLVWIQSFTLFKPVAEQWLKSPIWPTIYQELVGIPGYKCDVKQNLIKDAISISNDESHNAKCTSKSIKYMYVHLNLMDTCAYIYIYI